MDCLLETNYYEKEQQAAEDDDEYRDDEEEDAKRSRTTKKPRSATSSGTQKSAKEIARASSHRINDAISSDTFVAQASAASDPKTWLKFSWMNSWARTGIRTSQTGSVPWGDLRATLRQKCAS